MTYYNSFPNIYKVSNGGPAIAEYDVHNLPKNLYDYTYYPISKNSFAMKNGILQKEFPETHWYVPNHSKLTYRNICMDMKTKPITETMFN